MELKRVSVTLPENLISKANKLAQKRYEDRSTVMRQLLALGLKETMIKEAVESYAQGKVSFEKAAEMAEVSLWNFLDVLKEKKIPLKYRLEDAEKEIKGLVG